MFTLDDVENIKAFTFNTYSTLQQYISRIERYNNQFAQVAGSLQQAINICLQQMMCQKNDILNNPILKLHQGSHKDDRLVKEAQEKMKNFSHYSGLIQTLEKLDFYLFQIQDGALNISKLFNQKQETSNQKQESLVSIKKEVNQEVPKNDTIQSNQYTLRKKERKSYNKPNQKEENSPCKIRSKKIKKQKKEEKKSIQTPTKKDMKYHNITYGKLREFKFPALEYPEAKPTQQCTLCQKRDPQLGPVYEFQFDKDDAVVYYSHLPCVMWNPFVFTKCKNNIKVRKIAVKSFKRFMATKCRLCNQYGASLKCGYANCKKFYHFPCFMKDESFGDIPRKYSIICQKHLFQSKFPSCQKLYQRYKEKQLRKKQIKQEHFQNHENQTISIIHSSSKQKKPTYIDLESEEKTFQFPPIQIKYPINHLFQIPNNI